MEAVAGADLASASYPVRLERLLAARVGLWDVIRTARRRGSLDAAIRDHEPNALGALVATLPALRAVAFNGGAAGAIGRRALGDAFGGALVTLPSSSPAHTLPFETKRAAWLELQPFLRAAG